MQILSFFFLGLALVVAGYGAAFQAGTFKVAGALAVAGVLVCVGFFFLEERTRQLGRACEPALAQIQAALSNQNSANSNLEFVKTVHKPKIKNASYSTIIRSMIILSALLLTTGALYAFTADEPVPGSYVCDGKIDAKAGQGKHRQTVEAFEGAVVCHSRGDRG